MFLESICTADEIVESNVREVKVHSPDYKGVEANEAIIDFLERIRHYEVELETMAIRRFAKISQSRRRPLLHGESASSRF